MSKQQKTAKRIKESADDNLTLLEIAIFFIVLFLVLSIII